MGNSQFIGTDLTGQLDGLHAPHYFNGRLLTAEDLQADQQAVLTRQAWLGKAAGYGVIEGLMVTKGGPTSIAITAGIGLNPQGEIIRLPGNIPSLPLTPQATDNQPPPDAGRFIPCNFQSTGSMSSTPAGAYLLTAVPTSHFEGQVAMKAAAGSVMTSTSNGSTSSTPGCGSKWEVEGLQFKTIRLAGFDPNGSGVTDKNRRNLLAHWCYGSEHLPDLPLDPFHFNSDFGGLEQVDPADLTPCDLPLAVFYWTGTALSFVDVWSARHRLTHPDILDETQEGAVATIVEFLPLIGAFTFRARRMFLSGGVTPPERVTQPKTRTWKGIMSDKRVAVAQARFLQFQDQIQKFMDDGTASKIAAADYFRFLPPVSFLPILLAPLIQAPVPPEGPPIEVARSEGRERVVPLWMHAFTPRTTEGTAAAPPGAEAPSQQTMPFIPYLQFLIQQRQAQAEELEKRGWGDLVNNGTAGFNITTFFSGFQNVNVNIALVDGETVDFTLQQSWYDEAIDLNPILSPPTGEKGGASFLSPYLNLYLVAQNLMSPYDQPYLMIVKGMRPTVWANPQGQEARSVG